MDQQEGKDPLKMYKERKKEEDEKEEMVKQLNERRERRRLRSGEDAYDGEEDGAGVDGAA